MMDYIVKFTDSNIKNIILNICIFLFGINFLYKCNYIVFGTFILLLIFKNFKIKLGNKFTLIVLVLFSISWYIFGGHEIAGICLPICYLIGANINESDERGITKFILLVAISLALYTTLFFVNNAIENGIANYDVYNQPNIWTGRPLWATNIMLYSSLFNSLFGYIVFFEKNKKIKLIYFTIFVSNAFYALMLGRRAALLMVGLSFIIGFAYRYMTATKEARNNAIKTCCIFFTIILCALVTFVIFYKFNILEFKNIIKTTDLYNRFIDGKRYMMFFYDMDRSKIRKNYIIYFWKFPWGGGYLHDIVGNYAHDLWLDVYDVAGMITLVLMLVYSLMLFIRLFVVGKKRYIFISAIALSMLFCILAQFCIEPIMEACRAYMFGICMIHGCLEKRLV